MSGKVVLTGGLKFTSLADLFQIIGGNNSTGTLRISSQYTPDTGIINFQDGNPINAIDGNLKGLEAIYSLFGRTEGNFEFVEEKVPVEHVVKKSRMEIVLDALRMLDDGVIKKVEPLSTQEVFVGKPAKPEEQEKAGPPAIKGPAIDYLYILEEEEFYDGKTIVKEGTHGKWIWVLIEGKVKISKNTQRGPLTILHLGEGCYVGTFTSLLFHDYARSATVTAVGDVRLGLLDTQRLAGEFYTLSPVFRGMLVSLDRRLKKTTERVAELAMKQQGFAVPQKGLEVLIPMGSKRDNAYLISEGNAYVMGKTRKGLLPLVELGKDDLFGSIPFMDMGQEPRSASVAAPKDLKVQKLNVVELRDAYNQLSMVFKGMISNICTCVAYTTKLAYLLGRKE
jgi:Domain of unknown function (DUF4388)/Cyclic nucleotide-binding domain